MKQQSITNLPPSPDAERHSRMLKYSIMMGIRVVCIVVVLFVPGWWKLVPAMGAIFLPYFAVVIANVSRSTGVAAVERPGAIVRAASPGVAPPAPGTADTDSPGDGSNPTGAREAPNPTASSTGPPE